MLNQKYKQIINASKVQNLYSAIHRLLLIFLWIMVRIKLSVWKRSYCDSATLLVVSCDTKYLVGSKGDEAMLKVAVSKVLQIHPQLQVAFASESIATDAIVCDMGMQAMRVWGSVLMPFRFLKAISLVRPQIGILIGADVMDGYYSPVVSLRLIIAADVLARTGAKTVFLGFSMNDKSVGILKYAFRMLDKRVQINLRDPLSHARYMKFTGKSANLVADSAFMLKPELLSGESVVAQSWIELQKSLGRLVLGVNFHPMLFPNGIEGVDKLASSLEAVLKVLTDKYKISWLLLPHDDRLAAGDIVVLTQFYQQLSLEIKKFTHLVVRPPSAAQIKTLASSLDGVITGRMHLAIAALGQSVPVITFAYQDKFAGLFQHFDLPEWMILDPIASMEFSYLSNNIERFIQELPSIKYQISTRLPDVMAASESTFKDI